MRLFQRKSLLETFKLDQKGLVMPMVICFAVVFSMEGAGLASYASSTYSQIKYQETFLKTHYMAEAAMEKAVSQVRTVVSKTGVMPAANSITPPTLNGASFTYSAPNGGANTFGQTTGAAVDKKLTAGTYAGLNGNAQPLTFSITARGTGPYPTTVTINQTIEVQRIPLFQFGVFYQNDLEILPGPNMTFSGPVHSNGDIYLGTHNTLTFNSTITSYKSILHGRKDSSTAMLGNVFISDGAVQQNMKNGNGTWLDSSDGNWLMGSQTRWGGNVSSSVHGVRQLNLPIPSSTGPQTLIDRRTGADSAQVQTEKMDYKANLRIIDGAVMDKFNNTVELRYCSGGSAFNNGCPQGQSVVNPLSTAQFYNFREGRTIASTDIDVNLLNGSPAFQAMVSAANGVVIYTSDRRNTGSATLQDAVRLVNGHTLPVKGLTLASENPVYVKGDFNTNTKKPAGIVGDAFNIQSNAWLDANSTNTNLSNKNASATSVNAAVITGNTNTTTGNYNGGFENIHRFMENWSGVNLTYSGSVITLFNSRIAIGNWLYGGNQYTAPNRLWGFDANFSDANYNIPGFPSVVTVAKSSYEAV